MYKRFKRTGVNQLMTRVTVEQIITISQVAGIAIEAAIATYSYIQDNKDKYMDFFKSIVRYMDAMEIEGSNLTGKQKKEAVLVKVKEIAVDLMFNWDVIFEVVNSIIDDAKNIYNQMLSTKNSITDRLKTIKM